MRRIKKRLCPAILSEKEEEWLAELKREPTNATRKTRYRHPDIKSELVKETGWKCVYCESRIGHSTPGDIEHKVPNAEGTDQHFDWNNLTVACTECNRRKNDTYDESEGFLDPYSDSVEDLVLHAGPMAYWKTGSVKAETAIRVLSLNTCDRMVLIEQKINHLNRFLTLVDRWNREQNPTLKRILQIDLEKWKEKDSEYSAMIIAAAAPLGL